MKAVHLLLAVSLLGVSLVGCTQQSPGAKIFAQGIGATGPIERSVDGKAYTTSGKACANCHGTSGQGGGVAPAIDRKTLGAPRRIKHAGQSQPVAEEPWTPEQTVEVARKGTTPEGSTLGPRMPRWKFSTQDSSDLAVFLGTL